LAFCSSDSIERAGAIAAGPPTATVRRVLRGGDDDSPDVAPACAPADREETMQNDVTAPAVHVGLRCRFCGSFRHRREFVLPDRTTISPCVECYQAHEEALFALAEKVEPGCYDCRRKLSELPSENAHDDVSMCLHWKDGLYQLLCRQCSATYEVKKKDMYADTPYGHRRKLK
jgi:hypothetical protein